MSFFRYHCQSKFRKPKMLFSDKRGDEDQSVESLWPILYLLLIEIGNFDDWHWNIWMVTYESPKISPHIISNFMELGFGHVWPTWALFSDYCPYMLHITEVALLEPITESRFLGCESQIAIGGNLRITIKVAVIV